MIPLYGKISTLRLEHVQKKFLFYVAFILSIHIAPIRWCWIYILSDRCYNADLHFISFLLNGGSLHVSRLLFDFTFPVFHSTSLKIVLSSITFTYSKPYRHNHPLHRMLLRTKDVQWMRAITRYLRSFYLMYLYNGYFNYSL